MILGELIYSGIAYTAATPRGGSQAIFSVNVTQLTGGTLTITVQHRNASQNAETDWTTLVAFSGITSANGLNTATATDIKEEVRIKYDLSGTTNVARVFTFDPTWE